VTQFEHET